jgi:hypothetical protein
MRIAEWRKCVRVCGLLVEQFRYSPFPPAILTAIGIVQYSSINQDYTVAK